MDSPVPTHSRVASTPTPSVMCMTASVAASPRSTMMSVAPNHAAVDAARGPTGAAVHARAVAVVERSDDEVPPCDAVHLRPDLLHHTNELVADRRALRVVGLATVIPEIGAADARQHDADD